MWPFKDIKDWDRVDFDGTLSDVRRKLREECETRTRHDLQKPVQQFICDVHEEADRETPEEPWPNLTYGETRTLYALDSLARQNKRLTALLAVSAYQTGVTNKVLVTLAFITAIFGLISLKPLFFPPGASATPQAAVPLVVIHNGPHDNSPKGEPQKEIKTAPKIDNTDTPAKP